MNSSYISIDCAADASSNCTPPDRREVFRDIIPGYKKIQLVNNLQQNTK
jgi:hypothetical protein